MRGFETRSPPRGILPNALTDASGVRELLSRDLSEFVTHTVMRYDKIVFRANMLCGNR